MLKKILTIVLIFLGIQLNAQDLLLVQNSGGKYGFIDKYGDTIIDCKFDYAESFSNGLALVKNNLRLKIIDTTGKLHDLTSYDGTPFYRHNLGNNNNGLPIIVKVWECEYITSAGDVFLKIPYQDAVSFESGKAKVYDGDKFNYISRNGIILDSWQQTPDNFHAIKNKDGIFGYIDKNGNLVIDYQFVGAKDFVDGYGQISNGRFWALINQKGEKISDWYESISNFNGKLAVVKKLGNIGFINRSGTFIGEWYKSLTPLDFGLYKVEKYGNYAVINQDGYLVTQWFQRVDNFKDGYLKVEKDNKYAYLNKIAALVVGWYDTLSPVNGSIIRIVDNNKHAFYNVEKYTLSKFYDYIGDFYDGLVVVKEGKKFGYVDKFGKDVIVPEFDTASNFNFGIAQVEKNGKVAYIDTKGAIVMGWFDKTIYFFKEPPRGYLAVKYGSKWGFENINGKRVITAKYDYAENFSNGLALVKSTPVVMYIDKHGNLIPKTKTPDLSSLRLDLGYGHSGKPIEITAWKCAFIDYNGDVVISLDEYSDAKSFDGDKAMVINGDKYSFINQKGKLIENKWFDLPDNYHADYKAGKFGFIDKFGAMVIPYKFDDANDFNSGKAKVRIGDRSTGKYAIINIKGEYVTKMYDEIDTTNRNYLLRVKLNKKYSLIDTTGKEICPWYDHIFAFSDVFALVSNGLKYTFVNIKGQQFKSWFDAANDFSCGRAKVQVNGKWGFIDQSGDLVINPIYEFATNFDNYIAKVQKDGKVTFVDINGRMITDWFDQIYMFSDDRAVVVIDGKWGYIDVNGHVVIKPVYDHAFAFSNGTAIVVVGGKMLNIDKEGNEIDELQTPNN